MTENNSGLPGQYKVLMVDDDPVTLKLIRSILSGAESDYLISEALDGETALDMIKRDPPDIILLDIKMPGMDGFEVCRRLNRAENTRSIPVIFISTVTNNAEKMRAFELGAVDYLTKPFFAPELLARINIHRSILQLKCRERVKSMALEAEMVELNNTKEMLARSEKNWEDTFNAISEIITIHDMNFNILYANKAAEAAFGCGSDEMIGQKCYQVHHCKESPMEGCPCLIVAKNGAETTVEYFEPVLKRNIDLKVFPRFDDNGKLIGVVHVARDVTARKQDEEKMKRNLHNLEVFFKASIGRESRILELKKNIEELKSKIKRDR